MTFSQEQRTAKFSPLGPAPTHQDIIMIVEARFYDDIADELVAGAVAEIEAQGARWERITVPGCLEIPHVVSSAARNALIPHAAENAKYAGVVALGCVIRGETSHYDIVCEQTNTWLMNATINNGIPLGNGVLTVDTKEQAMARARGGRDGKGGDAARACLRLLELARYFHGEKA